MPLGLIANSDEHPAPVATEEASESPWSKVSLDFGSFPDGRTMMVLMDNYTKYPVVEIILSMSFPKVILELEKVFSVLALPEEIKMDNNPPFQ